MTQRGKPFPKKRSEQLGLVNGKRFEDFKPWTGKGLPLPENCDPTNPRQAFLWMFTAMPGVQGAPLLLGTEYWELQSWRMWVLGARPTEAATLKYQPPANMVANQWNAAGKWVTLDTPDIPRQTLTELVDSLPQQDKAELKQVMLDKMGLGDIDKPDEPLGHLRVDDLSRRLALSVEETITVLSNFGMNVTPESYVGRDVGERLVAHLGL